MRRIIVVGVSLFTFAIATSEAQTPATPQNVNVQAQPFQMPGTAIGKGIPVPIGGQLPKVAPQVGTKVGQGLGGNLSSALTPNSPRPAGTVIDTKNVIAPYPGQPKPAPSFWDQLQQRWFGLFTPSATPPRTFTPGLARRNRERANERNARWD